jgi:outer membrane protein, adhesin transport system
MKTRNILLLTVSAVSIASPLTADFDSGTPLDVATPALTVGTASIAYMSMLPSEAKQTPASLRKGAPSPTGFAMSSATVAAIDALAVSEAAVSVPSTTTDALVAVEPSAKIEVASPAEFVAVTQSAEPAPALGTMALGIMTLTEAQTSPAITNVPVPLKEDGQMDKVEEAAPAIAAVETKLALLVAVPPAPETIAQPDIAAIKVAPLTEPSVTAIATPAPAAGQAVKAAALIQIPQEPNYVFYNDSLAEPAHGSFAPASIVTSASVPATGMAGASDAVLSGNVSLEDAIVAALETNPEINQAIMNKEAIEFEREQAQGLYLPRVNLEASAGIRRLENPNRRAQGIDDNELYPVEGSIIAEQTVLDFGRRSGELKRQAARTDGAALRVVERSENIALLVSRQYLDILLQQRVVAASEDNVTFHRNLVNDLGQGVTQGSISIADQQQAQERLQAAIVRRTEAEEALINAQISLQALTGLRIDGPLMPKSLRASASPTVNEAVSAARQNNPKVREAMADVDAAHAMIAKAKGDFAPTVGLEVRGRVGNDIDGFEGHTNDVQGRVVMRWNVFDGGINRAKYQEMIRRASEARFRLHEVTRIAEEDVQRAWNSMTTQDKISGELQQQSKVSDDLLLSYREQFNVGRRSLLDVLDAQNTRYNVQVRLETARFSEQFAEYQVLAATNNLLEAMAMKPPAGGTANAREQFGYGPPAPAETDWRRYPRGKK